MSAYKITHADGSEILYTSSMPGVFIIPEEQTIEDVEMVEPEIFDTEIAIAQEASSELPEVVPVETQIAELQAQVDALTSNTPPEA